MQEHVEFENDGADIVWTNYFDLPPARAGLLFLSGQDGVYRLLVPPLQQSLLRRQSSWTGIEVVGLHDEDGSVAAFRIVFMDGSEHPFYVQIPESAVDRYPPESSTPQETRIYLYTARGKEGAFSCLIRYESEEETQ